MLQIQIEKTEKPGDLIAGCLASLSLMRGAFIRRDEVDINNVTAAGKRYDIERSREDFRQEAYRLEKCLEALKESLSERI